MADSSGRRQFLIVVGAAATAGCTSGVFEKGGRPLDTTSAGRTTGTETGSAVTTEHDASPADATEREGVELAGVQPQPLESYVGVSAVVYNDTTERVTVTVEFSAYDSNGTRLHRGKDSVTVPAFDQAPISMYWEKDAEDRPFQGWDARIVSVA